MLRLKFMPQPKTAKSATPAELGYSMPAEWEKHEATWLGWPHNASDWPGKFENIPWVYGEMARKISAGEKICLLVRHKADENFARRVFKHVGVDLRKIRFVTHPTNRGWTRDTGPIFIRKSEIGNRKSEIGIVHFHFNGWAKYSNWRKDTTVPETAARVLRKKLFHAQSSVPASSRNPQSAIRNFVIEGGGIELNGRGTLLSTEE